MTRLVKNNRTRHPPYLIIISVLMIVTSGVLFIYELSGFTQREDRLPQGITIAGIRVGGLSDLDAASEIETTYTTPVTLYYQDSPINLSPESVGFQVNTQVMLAEAQLAGEAGGGFWARFANYLLGREETVLRNIELQASYQRNALRQALEEIAAIYDRPAGTATYDLNTLTFSQGTTGYEMDIDSAIDEVGAALQRPNQRYAQLPLQESAGGTRDLAILRRMIIDYLDSQGFVYDGQNSVASVYVMDLTTGDQINILGDVTFTAASTNKVGILLDFYRQIENEPTQDYANWMANSLLCSNNSSSNSLLQFIGSSETGRSFDDPQSVFFGLQSVTETLQYLVDNTYLTAPFVTGDPNQQLGTIEIPQTNPNPNFDTEPDRFNQTTAEDMGTLFALIYDCANYGSGLMAAYPDDFNQRECRQMLELTSANDLERLLQGGIPPGIRISHKNGWFGEVTGEAGIVYPPNGRDYVISVFLWEDRGTDGFQDYIRLWPLIEDISRATWNFFSPQQALPQRRSDLPQSAQECLVQNASGVITQYNYLPPYGQIDLNNIDGWRNDTPTTPQP